MQPRTIRNLSQNITMLRRLRFHMNIINKRNPYLSAAQANILGKEVQCYCMYIAISHLYHEPTHLTTISVVTCHSQLHVFSLCFSCPSWLHDCNLLIVTCSMFFTAGFEYIWNCFQVLLFPFSPCMYILSLFELTGVCVVRVELN